SIWDTGAGGHGHRRHRFHALSAVHPIALATCLQIDAGCYNAFIQEQSLGIHYNAANDLLDYVSNREVFAYENGMVAIPQGPGLGIEVNEEYVKERAAVGHRWRNPIWRHADGSFAEW
ncbi:enolase C-terminal domain-like protein, partial [Achromobacter xylosoxidans]|uniref:enolase C-terminal domain-like protein n=1 Tax=Alcaligenes xylosoxydans xylosoxydans TaxID=85698 RepID=UPI003D027AB5